MSIEPSRPPGDAPCPACGSLIWFPPDSAFGDGYRNRVLTLVRQIEDLSHPSTEEGVFFPEFLARVLSAIGAPAGMVWMKSAAGAMIARASHGLDRTEFHSNTQADQLNESLLAEVFQGGRSQMFGAGEPSLLATPTNHLYVVTPLLVAKTCLGIVEILQRHDTDPRARPGYLQFIEQMGGYAARYIQSRQSQA